eukprot:5325693-Alexandrium_andersonii.AAC.1
MCFLTPPGSPPQTTPAGKLSHLKRVGSGANRGSFSFEMGWVRPQGSGEHVDRASPPPACAVKTIVGKLVPMAPMPRDRLLLSRSRARLLRPIELQEGCIDVDTAGALLTPQQRIWNVTWASAWVRSEIRPK